MHQSSSRLPVNNEQEYRAIEAALLDNPRGRWFLAEHGRRARRLDMAMLDEAIGRLQQSLRQPPALLGQLHGEIDSLKQFLRDTKNQLMSKPTPRSDKTASEAPADGILRAAEDLHELAWTLQSNDINAEACEKIARQASAIYALSLRQALEAERTMKLAAALDSASARLSAVLETIGHESQIDLSAPLPEEVAAMTALLADKAKLAEAVADSTNA
ncbi:MAG TPA: hypothetical protein VE665_10915 [Hyphomicrobiaceae bacterium]|jgi:hypothetical protein|nr:hypothetical protein [Hyphomicrobiaceae bacterium]